MGILQTQTADAASAATRGGDVKATFEANNGDRGLGLVVMGAISLWWGVADSKIFVTTPDAVQLVSAGQAQSSAPPYRWPAWKWPLFDGQFAVLMSGTMSARD